MHQVAPRAIILPNITPRYYPQHRFNNSKCDTFHSVFLN